MEFQEIQKLRLWWLYILLGIAAVIIFSIVFLHHNGSSLLELKQIYFLPISSILLPFIIICFVSQNSLKISITKDRITYRYWPFTKLRRIDWQLIDKVYLRKYDALGEYGGWGLRYKLWFKFSDQALLFNDEALGLQVELSHGKKFCSVPTNQITSLFSSSI